MHTCVLWKESRFGTGNENEVKHWFKLTQGAQSGIWYTK